jgi:hypothetical protein
MFFASHKQQSGLMLFDLIWFDLILFIYFILDCKKLQLDISTNNSFI